MQLAIILAILLMAGQNNFTQLKPIIEELGGEEGKQAIKQAEELNQLITTVKTLTSPQEGVEQSPSEKQQSGEEQPIQTAPNHPLDPVKNIADDKILSALSRYIALGE